jgi:hypothetical protein
MNIKTVGAAAASPESKVRSVHEAKTDLKIEFDDGSSATFCLANAGSSVAARDKNNAVEYLG